MVCVSRGHGAWGMEHGAWSMEHGAWSMGHGARSMGHGAWGMAFCGHHETVIELVDIQRF